MHAEALHITTNASGAATVYSTSFVGLLESLIYVPGTLATGADLTITDEASGHALLSVTDAGTSTVVFQPRGDTDRLPIVSRVKVVVAQGGNVASGTLYVVWEG